MPQVRRAPDKTWQRGSHHVKGHWTVVPRLVRDMKVRLPPLVGDVGKDTRLEADDVVCAAFSTTPKDPTRTRLQEVAVEDFRTRELTLHMLLQFSARCEVRRGRRIVANSMIGPGYEEAYSDKCACNLRSAQY